jgi:hypothetical protein
VRACPGEKPEVQHQLSPQARREGLHNCGDDRFARIDHPISHQVVQNSQEYVPKVGRSRLPRDAQMICASVSVDLSLSVRQQSRDDQLPTNTFLQTKSSPETHAETQKGSEGTLL